MLLPATAGSVSVVVDFLLPARHETNSEDPVRNTDLSNTSEKAAAEHCNYNAHVSPREVVPSAHVADGRLA